ncbi:MAG: hypothetical protein VX938_06115, partial [Myxococcota bacterium]|nr:hypothetical protein [Myxococcota bacterium]
ETLSVYVVGGGGGGAGGKTLELDVEAHTHAIAEHTHGSGNHTHLGGSHSHAIGTHSHTTQGQSCSTQCTSYTNHGCCAGYGTVCTPTENESAEANGSTADTNTAVTPADVPIEAAHLTTEGAGSKTAATVLPGGSGGSGGGMNALVPVAGDVVTCEIVIGAGGNEETAGEATTVTCSAASLTCHGGSGGDPDGPTGADGSCTVTGGTALSEYKAGSAAPGGGGRGGLVAGAGQAGAVTIRY